MIRHLALAASLLAVTASPGLSQTHSGSHDRSRNHGPGHVRPDSATHAAMHAALHGRWTGAISTRGLSTGMVLSVARDSLHETTLTVSTDQPNRIGATSDLVVGRDGQLRWTQVVSGTRCKATAMLNAATATTPEALSGKLSCDGVESTFTLKKTTA